MKLPYSNKLPIDRLGSCFDDTTNAYKFYWFLAILESILENNTTVISTKELAVRMIADAWYPLDYFKLSFGKQDGFKKIAQSISKKLIVDNSPNSSSLFNQLQNNPTRCVYSNESITQSGYSLDHFIPWTYIAHDQIWNLIPTSKTVNSMKSDWLPSLEKYFGGFVALQSKAFHFHYREKNIQLLEDYSLYFGTSLDDIFYMSTNTFKNRLKQQILPMVETAKNLGFSYPFVYQK